MYRNKREFTVVSASAPQPASNVWVCPGGVTRVRLVMYGGGGGGGGGCGGTGLVTWYSCGGGGGAGSLQCEVEIPVVPGTIYEAVVGAGGAGGAGGVGNLSFGGATGTNGAAGGNSLWRVQGGATLYTAPGGLYGTGGGLTNSSSFYLIAMGGGPSGRIANNRYIISITDQNFGINNQRVLHFENVPGSGGPGMTTHGDNSTAAANNSPYTLRSGTVSIQGHLGGHGGIMGYDDGSGYVPSNKGAGNYQSGGPGGGGGGGPGGVGGNGGSVYDDYMYYGGYTTGWFPGTPAANTGAGGGGGSGGFFVGASTVAAGVDGRTGGSGKIILYW